MKYFDENYLLSNNKYYSLYNSDLDNESLVSECDSGIASDFDDNCSLSDDCIYEMSCEEGEGMFDDHSSAFRTMHNVDNVFVDKDDDDDHVCRMIGVESGGVDIEHISALSNVHSTEITYVHDDDKKKSDNNFVNNTDNRKFGKRTRQHQAHQQDAGDHVKAVKAGEQIEHPAEHTAAEAEAEFRPFDVLAVNEIGAHRHGEQPHRPEAPEVALVQIALGEVGHKTGAHQDHAVDQGHAHLQPLNTIR